MVLYMGRRHANDDCIKGLAQQLSNLANALSPTIRVYGIEKSVYFRCLEGLKKYCAEIQNMERVCRRRLNNAANVASQVC